VVSTCASPENSHQGADDDVSGDETYDGLIDNRGAHFALRKNRLNVALSRAQCLAVVIGAQDLITQTICKSLQDAAALSFYSQIIAEGTCGVENKSKC
jgi:hypothetical protein